MSLFYASKYRREPGAQPKRLESIGFAGLAAALATVRDMNEVATAGDLWLVTTKVGVTP